MGGNFASATPDTAVTHAALERCRLTVQVSTKLNMSHLVTGDQALILPTMGRTERHEVDGREQVVTVEDSMGVVHASRGALPKAAPQLLSEVEIVCAMAEALFGGGDTDDPVIDPTIDWGRFARDHAVIRDSISRVVPGFDDFQAKVAAPGGFVLPHGPRDDRTFATPDGRAQFTVNEMSHAGRRARHPAAADDPEPRPVQHHDLRPRRPLSGRPQRSARGVRVPRTTSSLRASATATWSTCDPSTSTVSSGWRPGSA